MYAYELHRMRHDQLVREAADQRLTREAAAGRKARRAGRRPAEERADGGGRGAEDRTSGGGPGRFVRAA